MRQLGGFQQEFCVWEDPARELSGQDEGAGSSSRRAARCRRRSRSTVRPSFSSGAGEIS